MFELRVKGDGEMRRISMMPHLPDEISDTYSEQFGEISLTIMPLPVTDDPWEVVVDLSVDQATILRDALSVLIDHIGRNPRRP